MWLFTKLGPEPPFGRLGLGGSSGEYSSPGYTSHEYTSHPLLRAFGTQLGGGILCQNICSQFGPNFGFLDFSNVYFLEAHLNFFDGKPGLTECHGDPL